MPAISIDGDRIASVKQPHLMHDSVRAGWVGRVDSLLSCYRGSDSNVCVCTMLP